MPIGGGGKPAAVFRTGGAALGGLCWYRLCPSGVGATLGPPSSIRLVDWLKGGYEGF